MASPLDMKLTRREAFRAGGLSLGAHWFLPLAAPSNVKAAVKTSPRGSARFCIFVMLDGGQSHVDSWDLKEGKWTPPDFDIQEIRPGVKWPLGLYPRLAKQFHRLTLVRSMEARDSAHGRAQYSVQAARGFHPALEYEIPPVGTVVAMEYASRRREPDILPAYVALNVTPSQAGLVTSGFLSAAHSPFPIDTEAGLSCYWVDAAAIEGNCDARPRNHSSPACARTARLFELGTDERVRYGSTVTGDAAIVARNLVEADAGTHFIFLQQNGWDHHKDIYSKKNHYQHSWDLDAALANLLEDLATRRRADGSSLLDETMIVCMGEFGRTPGGITSLNGRDHYQYAFTSLFAGGGVKGGQIIGTTDAAGSRVMDPGWGQNRAVFIEDIACTIYSAMGIDWGKSIRNTPSGREFSYIEASGPPAAIAPRDLSSLFG